MVCYRLDGQLTPLDNLTAESFSHMESGVAVFTTQELLLHQKTLGIKDDILPTFRNIHFCKVEVRSNCMTGTFSIPVKNAAPRRKQFAYLLWNGRILFVDDEDTVLPVLKRLSDMTWEDAVADRFLYAFFETLLEGDLLYLEKLESALAKVEETLLNGSLDTFQHKTMALRKELLGLHSYYAQWVDVAQEYEENQNGYFSPRGMQLFKLITDRASRLQSYTQSLREYSIQLREMYQTQVDIHQNKVMKVLTVVTTVFLPLSLITSWYGMNFQYMPELGWPVSYPLLILISAVIVWVSLRFFKKKKFW